MDKTEWYRDPPTGGNASRKYKLFVPLGGVFYKRSFMTTETGREYSTVHKDQLIIIDRLISGENPDSLPEILIELPPFEAPTYTVSDHEDRRPLTDIDSIIKDISRLMYNKGRRISYTVLDDDLTHPPTIATLPENTQLVRESSLYSTADLIRKRLIRDGLTGIKGNVKTALPNEGEVILLSGVKPTLVRSDGSPSAALMAAAFEFTKPEAENWIVHPRYLKKVMQGAADILDVIYPDRPRSVEIYVRNNNISHPYMSMAQVRHYGEVDRIF